MNGMWGYKVVDQNYKSATDLIRLLVNTSGKGANLLLNIGPQPNGELPALALDRLREIGKWTRVYGETIYGSVAGPVKPCEWGATTEKDGKVYVHVCPAKGTEAPSTITIPMAKKPKEVTDFQTGKKVAYTYKNKALNLAIPSTLTAPDHVLVVKR